MDGSCDAGIVAQGGVAHDQTSRDLGERGAGFDDLRHTGAGAAANAPARTFQ